CEGAGEDAEILAFPASITISITLLLASGDGSRIDVERDPGVRVTQEFLGCLQIRTSRSQVGCQRVTEAVPSDHFAGYIRPDQSRADHFLEDHIGRNRLLPLFPIRGKEKVVIAVMLGFQ